MSFPKRREQLLERARQAGCQWFAAASPAAIGYLTGVFPTAPSLLLLSEKSRLLLAPEGTAFPEGEVCGYAYYSGEFPSRPMEDCLNLLKGRSFSGKAAVERFACPGWVEELFDGVVPADAMLREEMTRKDAVGLKGIRKCLALNAAVFRDLSRSIRSGVTELDVYHRILTVLAEETGEPAEIRCDILSGERTAWIAGGPTRRVLQEGEPLIVDLLVRHDGYWSDTTRTFFAGDPTPEQLAVHVAVCRALRAGEEALRRCSTAGEVDRAVKESLAADGYAGRMEHHSGHGLGYEPYGAPYFVRTSSEALEPGMVVTLEPGAYFPGRFGIRLENAYLLEESGVRPLFDFPEEPEAFILK